MNQQLVDEIIDNPEDYTPMQVQQAGRFLAGQPLLTQAEIEEGDRRIAEEEARGPRLAERIRERLEDQGLDLEQGRRGAFAVAAVLIAAVGVIWVLKSTPGQQRVEALTAEVEEQDELLQEKELELLRLQTQVSEQASIIEDVAFAEEQIYGAYLDALNNGRWKDAQMGLYELTLRMQRYPDRAEEFVEVFRQAVDAARDHFEEHGQPGDASDGLGHGDS